MNYGKLMFSGICIGFFGWFVNPYLNSLRPEMHRNYGDSQSWLWVVIGIVLVGLGWWGKSREAR